MDSKRGKIPVKQQPQALRGKYFSRRVPIGPCGAVIAFVILLVLIVLLLLSEPTDRIEGCAGDTVHLETVGNNIWPWEIDIREEIHTDPVGATHLSDIYFVPTANVKVYSTEKVFSSGNVFQANFSRSSGQILYVYQIESLVYEVTASSGNATTTDGKLLIFDNHRDYYNYVNVPDSDYLVGYTVLHKSFPIGANNTPITTVVTFNQSSLINHSYYYVSCTTPSNITFSFNATVKLWYYDYKDYGQKNCSVKQTTKGTNSCALYTSSTPYTTFAYVNPDPDLPNRPITFFDVTYNRVLPPPVLLVAGGVLVVVVLTILMYLQSLVS